MNYRTLGRSGLKVSEIGIGCEGFMDKPYEQVKDFVDLMEETGVNCIDLYSPNPEFRSRLGRPTCAPSGRTASTSAPGISAR